MIATGSDRYPDPEQGWRGHFDNVTYVVDSSTRLLVHGEPASWDDIADAIDDFKDAWNANPSAPGPPGSARYRVETVRVPPVSPPCAMNNRCEE